jgi:hypothetical protein
MVDFPPPEGPTMDTFVPGAISKERSLKIRTNGLVGYAKATVSSVFIFVHAYHVQILSFRELRRLAFPLAVRIFEISSACLLDSGFSVQKFEDSACSTDSLHEFAVK